MNRSTNPNGESVTDTIKGTRDALSVQRVFGDAYELDGIQVIPVARVAGGAGGGGGEGESADEDSSGSGFGSGFGMHVRALGVYEIRDGHAVWKPAVDVNRVIRGGQVLAGIAALCVTVVAIARR
jgi:uncharacterized spore protein YtfJ